jgi:hypothetical protein
MSTIPPAIHHLARQLLAGEPPRAGSSHGDFDRAVRACEKLRTPLAKLAGAAGFASLLSRALALTKRQAPSLRSLRVEGDGLLAGFNEIRQDAKSADEARGEGTILVAELLNLLVTFIGEPLTLQLVREAWPDMPAETLTLSIKEKP